MAVKITRALARILECRIGSLPSNCLGTFKSNVWDGMVERCEKRLTSWRRQYLSHGSGLTLLERAPCLASPYTITLFTAPMCWTIGCWQASYRLAKETSDIPKYHLVTWKQICKLLSKGGLKLGGLICLIEPYLVSGCGDLWASPIGSVEKWWLKSKGVWGLVYRACLYSTGWGGLERHNPSLVRLITHFPRQLGFRFWHHNWCWHIPLNEAFSNFYKFV